MEESPAPPQVSAIVVCHSCAPALRRCLQALEASAGRERMEIVVVDAGSQDESRALDVEFPNATFLGLPRNFGLVKALNIGMRTAKGEFYFLLNPAVEVSPDTVTTLASSLERTPDAVAVCPLLFDAAGAPAPQFYRLPKPETIARDARAGSWTAAAAPDANTGDFPAEFPSLAALMVRAYFLKGLRYIDERYGQSWGDAEICFQIRRAGRKIIAVPSARATLHPAPPAADDPSSQAVIDSDWALGAAAFAGKHFGAAAGIKLRTGLVLGAMGRTALAAATFRDLGYHFSRFGNLVTGQKIDGSQTAAV